MQLTRDGHLVCVRGRRLDRTSANRRVSALAQLRELNFVCDVVGEFVALPVPI